MQSTNHIAIHARCAPDAPTRGVLEAQGRVFPCAFGRAGVIAASEKREGDGATPVGVWALRRVLYRADRINAVATGLPGRAIRPDDGWCDDPADPAYNRPVRLPYPARHEAMFREDGLYDVVVVLGHNDDPPHADLGSAIFLHCAKRPDGAPAQANDSAAALNPTAGCVAMARDSLLAILAPLGRGATLTVAPVAPVAAPQR